MDLRPHPEQIRGAGRFFIVGIPVLCVAYLAMLLALHDLRPEHVLAVVIAVVLSFWSDGSRRLAWSQVNT